MATALALLTGALVGATAGASAPTVRTAAQELVFRGNGGKTLSPFRLTKPSTLRWQASGGIFQVFPAGLTGGSVNSQASSGATYLKPGRYKLTVNAIGSWVIRVAAGIERPQRLPGGFVGFTGNGGRDLPPFTVRRAGTLYWRAAGGLFQLFPDDLDGPSVNSQGRRGTTYMEAGTHQLTVNALGSWTIWWRP